ncbi:MAG: ABC transporter permease, partial [Chloroflexi bacterium]|nr:ABC transporter permease [Chloroflexota bacterium]
MAKTWIVARHEFSVTLGRVGYRISLAVVPVVALLAFIGIFIFQSVRSGEISGEAGASAETVRVGYVDLSEGEDGGGIFTSYRQQGRTAFVPYVDQETATGALLEGDIEDLYVFAPDYLRSGRVTRVEIKRSGIDVDGNSSAGALRRFVVSNLLEGRVETGLAERVVEPYRLTTVEVDEAGAEAADSELNFSRLVIFGAFGLLLTVSLFTAGGYLVQSVTEEKQNRVMEVLVSSVKPDYLIFGKLIGLGAVGLLQMGVWVGSGLLFVLFVGRMVDLPDLDFTFSLGALLLAFTYF